MNATATAASRTLGIPSDLMDDLPAVPERHRIEAAAKWLRALTAIGSPEESDRPTSIADLAIQTTPGPVDDRTWFAALAPTILRGLQWGGMEIGAARVVRFAAADLAVRHAKTMCDSPLGDQFRYTMLDWLRSQNPGPVFCEEGVAAEFYRALAQEDPRLAITTLCEVFDGSPTGTQVGNACLALAEIDVDVMSDIDRIHLANRLVGIITDSLQSEVFIPAIFAYGSLLQAKGANEGFRACYPSHIDALVGAFTAHAEASDPSHAAILTQKAELILAHLGAAAGGSLNRMISVHAGIDTPPQIARLNTECTEKAKAMIDTILRVQDASRVDFHRGKDTRILWKNAAGELLACLQREIEPKDSSDRTRAIFEVVNTTESICRTLLRHPVQKYSPAARSFAGAMRGTSDDWLNCLVTLKNEYIKNHDFEMATRLNNLANGLFPDAMVFL